MAFIAALVPFWILFELFQLVVCERFLGIKQIQSGKDLRLEQPSEWLSCVWVLLILTYWIWLAAMLWLRAGFLQIMGIILISSAGYTLRRVCGLRWVLVVLTIEGALRIGMLASLGWLLWRAVPV